MTGILIRNGLETETDTQGEHRVTVEAEGGVMPHKPRSAALILDFSPPELWENKFLLL